MLPFIDGYSTLAIMTAITRALLLPYIFFWAVLRRVDFNSQRFGTLCLFHLHTRLCTHPLAYEDGTQAECSETLAINLLKPTGHVMQKQV
jgi:hypothetical protein